MPFEVGKTSNLVADHEALKRRIEVISSFGTFAEARSKKSNLEKHLNRWNELRPNVKKALEYKNHRIRELEDAKRLVEEAKAKGDSSTCESMQKKFWEMKEELDAVVSLSWIGRELLDDRRRTLINIADSQLLPSLGASTIEELVDCVNRIITGLEAEEAEQRHICAIFESEIEKLKAEQARIVGEILGKTRMVPEIKIINMEATNE